MVHVTHFMTWTCIYENITYLVHVWSCTCTCTFASGHYKIFLCKKYMVCTNYISTIFRDNLMSTIHQQFIWYITDTNTIKLSCCKISGSTLYVYLKCHDKYGYNTVSYVSWYVQFTMSLQQCHTCSCKEDIEVDLSHFIVTCAVIVTSHIQ